MPRKRTESGRLAFVALAAALVLGVPPAPAEVVRGRVVVLGFDGADHRLVSQFIAEGKLPNLQKLATEGSFSPLRPTIPAQSAVSWSTFSTGLSPGRTGIFDTLRRDPGTYRPEAAVATEGKKGFLLGRGNRAGAAAAGVLLAFLPAFLVGRVALKKARPAAVAALVLAAPAGVFAFRFGALLPESVPTFHNNRRGTPFWEVAGKAGIRSVVLHVPATFPAVDYEEGRLLSGLGVPDVRGWAGTPSHYTSDPLFAPGDENESSVQLVRLGSNAGTIRTEVRGPRNGLFGEPPDIRTPMTLTVLPDGGRLRIEPEGSEPVTLKPGEWSPWVTFTFEFSSLVKLSGIGRFHLASIAPEIRLYLSPIHFNPAKLPAGVKITAPAGLAKDLAKRFGLFKTAGWSIDTWSMSEETIDEPTFLDDVTFTVRQNRKMMNGLLAEKDVRLYVQVYEFTDRVGHVMWRHLDPGHPAHEAEKAAKFARSVERNYAQMDQIVGDALKGLGPEDLLLVCSDHGFSTWRRSVNYNTWLAKNGFLALKRGERSRADVERPLGRGEPFPDVDWSRTRAYAMGLGGIYVNLRGREARGIVEPGAEYDALRAELRAKILGLVDEATGRRPVERVYTREEAYGSFDPNLIPDILVTNSEGYRVSRQASLGVVTPDLFEDNRRVWSGDHGSLDPDVVPGILLSSRRLRKEPRPGIADVPATIYGALGLKPPVKLDGEPLF